MNDQAVMTSVIHEIEYVCLFQFSWIEQAELSQMQRQNRKIQINDADDKIYLIFSATLIISSSV